MEEKKNAKQVPEIKDEELDQVTGGRTIKVDFKPVHLTFKDTQETVEKAQEPPDRE